MAAWPKKYIYALHYNWLTFLYDLLVKWTTKELTFKKALRRQANIRPGQKILDLGCGTGTLIIIIKASAPQALVIGCDGDKRILKLAQEKAAAAEMKIYWQCGLAFELPYGPSAFDHVFSTFLFHHLSKEDKLKTLSEVWRVLKPGGEFHLADWGKPKNWLMRLSFLTIQILDGFKNTRDNIQGLLSNYLKKTGFISVREIKKYSTFVGSLSLYQAKKP